jgi:hypothetical protein
MDTSGRNVAARAVVDVGATSQVRQGQQVGLDDLTCLTARKT